jgi:transcriptional regulator with XRE-family HTH domain
VTVGIRRQPLGREAPGRNSARKSVSIGEILAVCSPLLPCHDADVDLKRPRTPHYDDPVAVGQRLHTAREAAGISQRELAFPGCSAAYISRIERGERIPSLQVMRELARRIGISESRLAYGRERIDVAVRDAVEAAEAAEAAGDPSEVAKAYRTLSRVASQAARSAVAA